METNEAFRLTSIDRIGLVFPSNRGTGTLPHHNAGLPG